MEGFQSMDARLTRAIVLAAAFASLGASYRTENFIVTASTSRLAERIGTDAEMFRKKLAVEWLGREIPRWPAPCPITANVAPHLGAGGATSFTFHGGQVGSWQMTIQGSEVRILDSVLPHEVTHTIFATHFRQPLPRWADEGACTTVEAASERMRHQKMLIRFLQTDRGIAFSRMFAMKEYPPDMLPLYAQGYSLARFLIEQGGKRKFIEFVGDGLGDENWTRALRENYSFDNLLVLQNTWLDWVRKGSPTLAPTAPRQDEPAVVLADTGKRPRPTSPNLLYRVPRNAPNRVAVQAASNPPPPANHANAAPRNLATNGWRAAGSRTRAPLGGGYVAGADDDAQQHQAVRQQPPQQPQQRVLP